MIKPNEHILRTPKKKMSDRKTANHIISYNWITHAIVCENPWCTIPSVVKIKP